MIFHARSKNKILKLPTKRRHMVEKGPWPQFLFFNSRLDHNSFKCIRIRLTLWGCNISSELRSFLKCISNGRKWNPFLNTYQPIDVVHFDTYIYSFILIHRVKLRFKYNLLLSFAFTIFCFRFQRGQYVKQKNRPNDSISILSLIWCVSVKRIDGGKFVMRFNSFIRGS